MTLLGSYLTTRTVLLQSFFYDLLRDGAPAGHVERVVSELETLCFGALSPERIQYSNMHLARYSAELADRVEKALEHKLKPGE